MRESRLKRDDVDEGKFFRVAGDTESFRVVS